MRNLLCVIGRHEWRTKYDTEGRPFEQCGRPGAITFVIATLGPTGHSPEPIEVSPIFGVPAYPAAAIRATSALRTP